MNRVSIQTSLKISDFSAQLPFYVYFQMSKKFVRNMMLYLLWIIQIPKKYWIEVKY